MAEFGIKDFEFGDLSKHSYLKLRMNGQTRRITFPSSPGEARGLQNALAFTRRTIRTLQ